MLIYDGFEAGHFHHECHAYDADTEELIGVQELGNMFIPDGWGFFFKHGGSVPWDADNPDGYAQPEARFSEHFTNRIHKGIRAFLWFGFHRVTDAGLFRTFRVTPGDWVRADVMAHGWSSDKDNPLVSDGVGEGAYVVEAGAEGLSDAVRNMAFWIGIDPTGGSNPFSDRVVWGDGYHIYNDFAPVEATVQAEALYVTVFIRGINLWRLKHNDFYVDSFELETFTRPQPGDDIPDFVPPRMQYKQTTILVPQKRAPGSNEKLTLEQFLAAARIAYDQIDDSGLVTITGSADVAGQGPKDRTVLPVSFEDGHWDREALRAFFDEYYPGATLEYLELYIDDDDEDPPTPSPTPTPTPSPSPGPPDPVNLTSGNGIGLHCAFMKKGTLAFVRQAKPRVMKMFSCGDTVAVNRAFPGTLAVWRKHIYNDGALLYTDGRFRTSAELRQSARTLLDLYLEELDTAANNMTRDTGRLVTPADLIRDIDVIESFNEVIGTYDPETPYAVEFDCHFADLVDEEFGDQVKAGFLTVAIGNPHESEVEKLLPAAQTAHEGGHYIAYHSYWTANGQREFLRDHWPYHAGRWTEWDVVFNDHGYYPQYYFGEGGIVYAPDQPGTDFRSGQGWKSCGDFPNYLRQLEAFQNLMTDWNRDHQNRAVGLTIFTYGGWGWEDFDFDHGALLLLQEKCKSWV